jgi:RNA polymerase sigma-70 factor (ECF subfamily)
VRGAEPPAIAALVERFQQPVGSYLLYLVGDLDRALVLAEKTFVQAQRAGLATQLDLSAQSWLYRRATQLALTELRRRQPQARSLGQLSLGQPTQPPAEDRDVVLAVLGQLRPGERALLLLCDREGLSAAEVAAILGRSAERVQRQLGRARARFGHLYLLQHTLGRPHPNGATTRV